MGSCFEDKFEDSLRRKSFKYNQCDFASVGWGNLRKHLKINSGVKSFNVIMPLSTPAIWRYIWKLSLENKRKNESNLTLRLSSQAIWFEKRYSFRKKIIQMQPICLCICSPRQFEWTFENSLSSYKCNHCEFTIWLFEISRPKFTRQILRLRPIFFRTRLRLFLSQKISRPTLRLYFQPKFLRSKFSIPIINTLKKWGKSWDREVWRHDVTLWRHWLLSPYIITKILSI